MHKPIRRFWLDRASHVAAQMGVDVSSHDPVAIAKGFGWATTQITTPEQLTTALQNSFAANSPQFIRVVAN